MHDHRAKGPRRSARRARSSRAPTFPPTEAHRRRDCAYRTRPTRQGVPRLGPREPRGPRGPWMGACGFASTTALTTPSPRFMIFPEPPARFETRTKFLFPTSSNLGAASDRWNEHARHSREARCGQSQVAPPYHGRVRTHPNGRGGRFAIVARGDAYARTNVCRHECRRSALLFARRRLLPRWDEL